MIQRNLDGVYFRMERDGKWTNVCFSDLTEEEMDKVMKDKEGEWLKRLCKHLARALKSIGDQLDLACE